MFHYELTIPNSSHAKNIDISIFSMPVLDSRMYIIHLPTAACGRSHPSEFNQDDSPAGIASDGSVFSGSEALTADEKSVRPPEDTSGNQLLIIDPVLWDETDDSEVRRICSTANHATVLLTHSHYDHIAGINTLRELLPVTVYATSLCDSKLRSPHRNLAAYSMALVIDKPEEHRRYCEEHYDFEYCCQADQLYEDRLSLYYDAVNVFIHAVPTPGHSDCSQCIELWYSENPEACSTYFLSALPSGHGSWEWNGLKCASILAVFTGDSLVNGHEVITRFPSGSIKVFRETTEPYLCSLPDNTIILPGHGDPGTYGSLTN